MIRSKNYSCGWSSRYAVIIAVMLISSSNTRVESRHWYEHAGSTDQGDGCRTERFAVCSASSWCCKWCSWDVNWSSDCNHQGTLTIDEYARMLSDLEQLEPTAHAILSGIQVIYKVSPFSVSNANDMTDNFAAFEDSKGILWSHEEPCKQHPSALWPAQQAQGSFNARPIMLYHQRVSRDHGRGGQLHPEMDKKSDVYVSIHRSAFVTD